MRGLHLKKMIKWSRKWSFVIMLLMTEVIYLTYTDNWQVYCKVVGKWVAQEKGSGAEKEADVLGKAFGEIGEAKPGDISTEVPEGGASLTPEGEGQDGTGARGESQGGAGSVGESQGGTGVGGGAQGGTGDGTETGGEAPGTAAGNGSTGNGESGETSPEELTYRDPEDIVYVNVEDSYFSDALFLGDSRTVGMYEYGGLKDIATFYASTGLNIYKLLEAEIVEVPDQKAKLSVEQALSENYFEKIYLMIGINEMGTGTVDSFMEKYREVVARLQELQPDAIIYLQGIMKVTTQRSEKGDYITNEGIEARNTEIAGLADNVRVYYLDVNPYICDETGGMEDSYTYDGVHLKAQYITIWKDYLKSHAVDELLLD